MAGCTAGCSSRHCSCDPLHFALQCCSLLNSHSLCGLRPRACVHVLLHAMQSAWEGGLDQEHGPFVSFCFLLQTVVPRSFMSTSQGILVSCHAADQLQLHLLLPLLVHSQSSQHQQRTKSIPGGGTAVIFMCSHMS